MHQGYVMARFAMANKTAVFKDVQAFYSAMAAECRGPFTGRTAVKAPNWPLFLSDPADVTVLGRSRFETMRAVIDLLRLEVALRRFHLQHGRYPARLSELAPAHLPQIPADPYGSGRPYVYRLTADGYLLYSLGPDMRDDGGLPGKYPGADPPSDIVAGHLWQKRTR